MRRNIPQVKTTAPRRSSPWLQLATLVVIVLAISGALREKEAPVKPGRVAEAATFTASPRTVRIIPPDAVVGPGDVQCGEYFRRWNADPPKVPEDTLVYLLNTRETRPMRAVTVVLNESRAAPTVEVLGGDSAGGVRIELSRRDYMRAPCLPRPGRWAKEGA